MELRDYETGNFIREATRKELEKSIDASRNDGGAGVITVDGVRCYVTGELDIEKETYYGNNESTYYVNKHGVIFCVQSPDMVGDFSRATELPKDVIKVSLFDCAMAEITVPDSIEDVTD